MKLGDHVQCIHDKRIKGVIDGIGLHPDGPVYRLHTDRWFRNAQLELQDKSK